MMMMGNNGLFITFEGGEGAGKSTLIDGIAESLSARGYPTVKTREPGGTVLGEKIRHLLLEMSESKMSSYAELCLFLASRAQHIKEVIVPSLQSKKIVLCDRFNDSSIVYQGYARDLGMDAVDSFCKFISENLKPDITIYLDIDPSLGLKRVKREPQRNSMSGLDRIEAEHISFHQKIRDGFHLLVKKELDRFFVVDASQSKEQVLQESLEFIYKKIGSINSLI
jgi:dTMP kinase